MNRGLRRDIAALDAQLRVSGRRIKKARADLLDEGLADGARKFMYFYSLWFYANAARSCDERPDVDPMSPARYSSEAMEEACQVAEIFDCMHPSLYTQLRTLSSAQIQAVGGVTTRHEQGLTHTTDAL